MLTNDELDVLLTQVSNETTLALKLMGLGSVVELVNQLQAALKDQRDEVTRMNGEPIEHHGEWWVCAAPIWGVGATKDEANADLRENLTSVYRIDLGDPVLDWAVLNARSPEERQKAQQAQADLAQEVVVRELAAERDQARRAKTVALASVKRLEGQLEEAHEALRVTGFTSVKELAEAYLHEWKVAQQVRAGDIARWRAEGRVEAAELVMEQDPELAWEGFPSDLTTEHRNMDGDYTITWNRDGVLKFFDAPEGGVVASVLERADLFYWSTRHELETANTERDEARKAFDDAHEQLGVLHEQLATQKESP